MNRNLYRLASLRLIPSSCYRIYLFLLSVTPALDNRVFVVKAVQLSEMLNISVRSVYRSLDKLVKCKFLIQVQNNGRQYAYRFAPESEEVIYTGSVVQLSKVGVPRSQSGSSGE